MYNHHIIVNILSWNIKGYRETIDGIGINKLGEEEVRNKLQEYDIVCLQETHLEKESADEVSIPGFNQLHHCRKRNIKARKASGGISIYVKEHLRKYIKFTSNNNSDIAWMKVNQGKGENLFIGCVYIPPENSTYGRKHTAAIWDRLESELREYSSKGQVILCGDFNARTGTLTDYIENDLDNSFCPMPSGYQSDVLHDRRSMDKSIHKNGRRLANICIDYNLCILNGRTIGDLRGKVTCITPQGTSVVDYFLCSKHMLKDVYSMSVLNLSKYSDHCPLELSVYLPAHLWEKKGDNSSQRSTVAGSKTISASSINTRSRERIVNTNFFSFSWTDKSAELIKEALSAGSIATAITQLEQELSAGEKCNSDDINDYTNKLTSIYQNAARISLTCRTVKKNNRKRTPNRKWFDSECLQLRKELRSILNALNRYPFQADLREKYFSQRKLYNSKLKQKKRQYKNTIVKVLNEAMEKDPNSVWSLLQQLKNAETDIGNKDTKIAGSKWITHLETLLNQKGDTTERNQEANACNSTNQQTKRNPLLDFPVTIAEISNAAKRLKPKKSPGKDGISNELIKAGLPKLLPIMHTLFNRIVQTGIYPDPWKQGINIPIFKAGDPYDPNNYRGITLNNAMANLFCQVINNRLTNFLEQNNLLAKEQAGFRKSCRTQDQVFILQKLIDDTIRHPHKRLYSCFIDFSKAFDNVWHEGLLYKLKQIGIQGNIFQVIQSMYSNASVCARTPNGLSSGIRVQKGVLQGNSLSPTLFNVFINDIVEHFKDNDSPTIDNINKIPIPCLMYADDIVILSTSKNGLQNKLDNLNSYCKEWGLTVNLEKTKVVIFTRIDPKIPIFFKLGESVISVTESYKYLGVILHKHGDLKLAQEHLSRQGTKAIHSLRRSVGENKINIPVMTKLFDALITPILTFSAEVWLPYSKEIGSKNREDLATNLLLKSAEATFPHEKVHLNFCKQLLGVHNKAVNIPVLAELGRYPLTLQIITQLISFWMHITQSNDGSLLKHIYQSMLSSLTTDNSSNSWLAFIKDLLYSLGFQHVWHNQGTMSLNRLKHSILKKLKYLYEKLWERSKDNTSKLTFYASISNRYIFQEYLLSPKEYRQFLSKLRISAHELEIERGRYVGLPREQRLCKNCGVLEDELHFLDVCPAYDGLRERLFSGLNNSHDRHLNSPIDKVSYLFAIPEVQGQLAKHVHDCFNLRTTLSTMPVTPSDPGST